MIEVSKNKRVWVEIDKHVEDGTLNGKDIVKNFNVIKIPNDFYRYIRIRQIGCSWFSPPERYYFLCLSQIGLFGKLQFHK